MWIFAAILSFALLQGSLAGPNAVRVYDNFNQNGGYADVTEYQPQLYAPYDNAICSVCQTGVWLYYSNFEFNLNQAGQVYWFHGIDFCGNFPAEFARQCSSLKYAGSPTVFNEDSYTMYSGKFYSGNEFYGNVDTGDMSFLNDDGSSMILIGNSPWTFYDGLNWSGHSVCVYPDTDHDVGSNGGRLDIGFIPDITAVMNDNSINSARKGCWSKNIYYTPKVETLMKTKNGAMGQIKF